MRGPVPGTFQHRRETAASTASAPLSYDSKAHEVTATLSKGSPVVRAYGTERLEISARAIDLSRLEQGGIPVLDHHRQDGIDQILGRITDAWISSGALMGRIKFAQTEQGRKAEGMVARGELSGISVGYTTLEWRITDPDGNVIDPEKDRVRWDDELTFTATRWQLFEGSLVGVPADAASSIRSLGGRDPVIAGVKARMQARERMSIRARMVDRMGRLLHDD